MNVVIGLARRAQRTLGPLAAAAWAAPPARAQAQDAATSTVPRLDEAAALAAGQAVIGGTPPDFTFLDRQGKPVRLSQYRGKPLLVNFIYTGCFEICPPPAQPVRSRQGPGQAAQPQPVQRRQHRLQPAGRLAGGAALVRRAVRHQVPQLGIPQPARQIVEPLTRSFGFSYLATPAGFDHILGVTVLDAEGKIATQVWGDRLTAQQLGEPLRQLLGRAPVTQRETLTSLLERVRILCTVYDPGPAATAEYALVLSWWAAWCSSCG